jgi:hypothetical protein
MADWANPLITTQYDVFVSEAKARDVDAATMFLNAPSNQPTGAIKLVRTPIKFQEWDGAAWVDKLLDLTGGGTGSASAAGARTNLGIGTMGVQNSNAVAITGGTIAGVTSLDVSGPITFSADASWDVGTLAKQARRVYIKDALVLPVGTDRYATS